MRALYASGQRAQALRQFKGKTILQIGSSVTKGLGAGAITPVTLAIIGDLFAPAERARIAARGRVDEALLDKLLTHPYLKHEPPKPTPGKRKWPPMRTSPAMPCRTWLTLAPTFFKASACFSSASSK